MSTMCKESRAQWKIRPMIQTSDSAEARPRPTALLYSWAAHRAEIRIWAFCRRCAFPNWFPWHFLWNVISRLPKFKERKASICLADSCVSAPGQCPCRIMFPIHIYWINEEILCLQIYIRFSAFTLCSQKLCKSNKSSKLLPNMHM